MGDDTSKGAPFGHQDRRNEAQKGGSHPARSLRVDLRKGPFQYLPDRQPGHPGDRAGIGEATDNRTIGQRSHDQPSREDRDLADGVAAHLTGRLDEERLRGHMDQRRSRQMAHRDIPGLCLQVPVERFEQRHRLLVGWVQPAALDLRDEGLADPRQAGQLGLAQSRPLAPSTKIGEGREFVGRRHNPRYNKSYRNFSGSSHYPPSPVGALAPAVAGVMKMTTIPRSPPGARAPVRWPEPWSPALPAAPLVECAGCDDGPSWAASLRCEECGASYPLGHGTACERCLGPLVVEYRAPEEPIDLGALWGRRPPTLFRFAELLPPAGRPDRDRLDFPASPLRRARRLGDELGVSELWIKDDTLLSSGSFKDRPAAVAVARARAERLRWVGCASTGNLAAATARAAARVGLGSVVVVPAGLPSSKLLLVRHLGSQIVEVEGSYDDANRIAQRAEEEFGGGFLNIGLRPYYAEGSKTLYFETWTELGHSNPDAVLVPLGSGALLSATERAIQQLGDAMTQRGSARPRLIGSQPEGCSPIVDAFERGEDRIRPVEAGNSIAESLAIGNPASGRSAVRAIRGSGGVADRPRRSEVIRGVRDLARYEGVWSEPAGGSVVATLRRLRANGAIRRSDRVVLFITGAGWKTTTAIRPRRSTSARVRVDPRRPDLSFFAALSPQPPAEVAGW